MKKVALLFAAFAVTGSAMAQINLSGTSYNQNFDNIGSGLPIGWDVQTGASATAAGTSATFNGANLVAWSNVSGAFKNFASADGLSASSTSADQSASTDRALGIRQTTSVGDPGAAFVFRIANTNGLSNFQATFKLQSLDAASTRTTTWAVDYGFGATPSTFTDAGASGTLTTGNTTFANNTVTVNFGNALDNQGGNVWIRIVALTATTGTGTRASSAIDDFSLTWTGSGVPNNKPNVVSLLPADNSTNVTANANLQITFDRQVTAGTGNITLKNVTTQTANTFAANSANVAVNGNVVTVSNTGIALGNAYYVTFDSTAFDTAGFKCYGIYDTTAWNFSADTTVVTPPLTVTSLSELFDAACAAGGFPNGWTDQNVAGPNQKWRCAGTNTFLEMNGFQGGSNDNEDWLFTPKLNLTAANNPLLAFRGYKGFTGSNIDVLVSTNYTPGSLPSTATWNSLQINFSAATNQWATYTADLNPYKATPFHIAFKYSCTAAAGDCAQWRIDSVFVQGTAGINNTAKNNQLPVAIIGNASNEQVLVGYFLNEAANVTVEMYDLTGRKVYAQSTRGNKGNNTTKLEPATVPAGMYIIRLSDGVSNGVAKAIIQ